MKWIIVVLLISDVNETSAGGGLFTIERQYQSLAHCSIAASKLMDGWREAYRQLDEEKERRKADLREEFDSKYPKSELDKIIAEAKASGLKREDFANYLRDREMYELARYLDRFESLDAWEPERQRYVLSDSEAICAPTP